MSGEPEKAEISEEERSLARIGASKWNDYQGRFVPVENQVMEQIRGMDTAENADRVGGVANADVQQQFQAPPTSTNLRGLVDAYDRQGSILSNAVPKAMASVKDTQLQGMLKMNAYGRGLSDQATMSLYKSGVNATQAAIDSARADTQSTNDWMGAAGTAAGAAARRSGFFDDGDPLEGLGKASVKKYSSAY